MRNETKRIKFEAQRAESLHKFIQIHSIMYGIAASPKASELPASILASITGADVLQEQILASITGADSRKYYRSRFSQYIKEHGYHGT